MIPTTRFRYIERQDFTDDLANPQTLRILQQWWEPTCQYGCDEVIDYRLPTERWIKNVDGAGEWRDVPLEEEK